MRYHLKLIKGLSYSGVVSATRKDPDVYVDDETIANAAVASGYFRIVSKGEEMLDDLLNELGKTEEHHYTQKELEGMNLEQLKDAAKAVGVVETKGFKKADYVNAILWAEGDYSTGSPTMTDLQEK